MKNSLLGLSLLTLAQASTAGTMGPVSAPTWTGIYAGLNAVHYGEVLSFIPQITVRLIHQP